MNRIWVWVVVVLLVGGRIGAGMLVDHRRYRGTPDQRGVTGGAKRRAPRRDRAAMTCGVR